jgi:hypothetical protein
VVEEPISIRLLDEVHYHLNGIEDVLSVALLEEIGELYPEASRLRLIRVANTPPILGQTTSAEFPAKHQTCLCETVRALRSQGTVGGNCALVDSLGSIIKGE